MLKRLTVRGFKSLRDVTVDLPRFAVLFGPNAAGKSNFLEAIQALAWIGNARTLNDALSAPFPVRGYAFEVFSRNGGGVSEQLVRGDDRIHLEADIAAAGQTYRYRVEPRIAYATGALSVADEYLARLGVSGKPKGAPAIERFGDALRVRRKGRGSRPRQEPLDPNHSILSDRSLSGPGYEWLDDVRSELMSWRTHYLEPRTLMRTEQAPAAVQDVGIHGEFIAPFLYHLRATHSLHFEAVRRKMRMIVPGIEDVRVELNQQTGTLSLTVLQDGVEYSSRVASEGTLRVLALCAIAVNPWPSSLVTFEEPENGVHPRRLQDMCELLLATAAERQVVVTTHSPLVAGTLLRAGRERERHDGIGLFTVRSSPGGTKIRPFDMPGRLFDDSELMRALNDRGEEGVFEGLVLRGLVDG